MALQPIQAVTEYMQVSTTSSFRCVHDRACFLQKHVDHWQFDIFEMEQLSEGLPFRYVAHHLLKRHNLFEKCDVSVYDILSFP